MTRKISLALAIVMLLSSVCLVGLASGTYLGSLQVVNCKEWVTLRSYASTKAATVTRVPLGAWVEGYSYNSEFTECYYNGMHGYILSSYLSGGYTPDNGGNMRVAFCNEYVTLRAKPSTKANAVTRVPLGEVVEGYYYNSEFYHCYYRGMEGYILSRYLVPADQTIDDSYFPMTILNGATGEWKKKGDNLSMRIKVTNVSSYLTVKAFEVYMYAENVWGDRIYGSTIVYTGTTTKTVGPGTTTFSDYVTMPQRSQIYKVYAAIKRVRLSDGTTRENDSMSYCSWTIS